MSAAAVKKACGWCGEITHDGPGVVEITSHGICDRCKAAVLGGGYAPVRLVAPLRVFRTDVQVTCARCGEAGLFRAPGLAQARELCMGCALVEAGEVYGEGADFDLLETPLRLLGALEALAADGHEAQRQAALGGH